MSRFRFPPDEPHGWDMDLWAAGEFPAYPPEPWWEGEQWDKIIRVKLSTCADLAEASAKLMELVQTCTPVGTAFVARGYLCQRVRT